MSTHQAWENIGFRQQGRAAYFRNFESEIEQKYHNKFNIPYVPRQEVTCPYIDNPWGANYGHWCDGYEDASFDNDAKEHLLDQWGYDYFT